MASHPSAESMSWTIVTHATSANLGSGFDLLAAAFDLRLRVRARLGREVSIQRRGCARTLVLPPDEDWTWIAARDWALRHGREMPPLELDVDSEIPIARGLGSSAAAIVAGLELANAVLDLERDETSMLAFAAELEGHGDNAAACLRGGLTWISPLGARPIDLELSPRWRFVLCWPELEIATAHARSILPRQVPLPLAVRHAHRFVRLLLGLCEGNAEALREGLEDELHVPFRSSLIPGFDAVCAAAIRAGARGATLSGSGSTLIAIADDEAPLEIIGRTMVEAFEENGLRAVARVSRIVTGPTVTIGESA